MQSLKNAILESAGEGHKAQAEAEFKRELRQA
jgi:hypothetical protein